MEWQMILHFITLSSGWPRSNVFGGFNVQHTGFCRRDQKDSAGAMASSLSIFPISVLRSFCFSYSPTRVPTLKLESRDTTMNCRGGRSTVVDCSIWSRRGLRDFRCSTSNKLMREHRLAVRYPILAMWSSWSWSWFNNDFGAESWKNGRASGDPKFIQLWPQRDRPSACHLSNILVPRRLQSWIIRQHPHLRRFLELVAHEFRRDSHRLCKINIFPFPVSSHLKSYWNVP